MTDIVGARQRRRETAITTLVDTYAECHVPRLRSAWEGLQLALRGLGVPEYDDPELLEYRMPECQVIGRAGLAEPNYLLPHGFFHSDAAAAYAAIDTLCDGLQCDARLPGATRSMQPVEDATVLYRFDVRPVAGSDSARQIRLPRPGATLSHSAALGQLGLDCAVDRALAYFDTITAKRAEDMERWAGAIGSVVR